MENFKNSKEQKVYIEILSIVQTLENKRSMHPFIDKCFKTLEMDLAMFAMDNEDKIWNK